MFQRSNGNRRIQQSRPLFTIPGFEAQVMHMPMLGEFWVTLRLVRPTHLLLYINGYSSQLNSLTFYTHRLQTTYSR